MATGELDLLTLSERVPQSSQDLIGRANALGASREFAAQNAIDLRGLTPEVVIVDHGEFAEYRVSWTLRVHGALVPDQRVFSINPQTAEVFGYVNVRRPYSDPGPPVISGEAALTAATRSLGGDAALQSTDLVIRFTPSGKQLLMWELLFEETDENGYAMGRLVKVDATTGHLLTD